jgi:hypothetical protein
MFYKVPNSPQISCGNSRIEDIKHKISIGYNLDDLKKEYPITKALFLKLGGVIPKYLNMNHPAIKEIVGDGLIPEVSGPLDTEVIIGTILGDGNIYNYGNGYCVFSFAHSAPQIGYVKLKYDLLKSYIQRIRYVKNINNDCFSFHVLLRQLPVFFDYYKIFYTANKDGKKNPQKYLFSDKVVNLITLRTFAFWLMDDGKKYGSGRYMFSITIGKQPYYTYKDFKRFVGILNDKLSIDMRAREEKITYEITTTSGTAEKVYQKIQAYIWPYFSYKFRVALEDCGQVYRELPWFLDWRERV